MEMARAKIKRQILSVLIESPFYFTLPLRGRLELLNFYSQQSVYHRICAYNDLLISEQSDSKEEFAKA
jgi:hypothetical protein